MSSASSSFSAADESRLLVSCESAFDQARTVVCLSYYFVAGMWEWSYQYTHPYLRENKHDAFKKEKVRCFQSKATNSASAGTCDYNDALAVHISLVKIRQPHRDTGYLPNGIVCMLALGRAIWRKHVTLLYNLSHACRTLYDLPRPIDRISTLSETVNQVC